MTTDKPSFEQERELGKLTAAANLQRMRGQWTEAEDLCRKALEIAPRDIAMREMLGDVLRELGKLDQALNEYKTAMQIAPGRASLENKHATLILEIGERERTRAIAQDMLENPKKYTKRKRSPVMALVCALVFPGLGQFFNGDITKGVVIASVFVLFLIAFGMLQSYHPGMSTLNDLANTTNPVVLILGILSGVAYLYGLIDAPLAAEKSSKAAAAGNPSEPT